MTWFALALALAGGVTAALSRFIPTRLNVTTDVLGFPTRFNFNVFRQWYLFGLLVFVLPIGTVLTYALITRRVRGRVVPDSRNDDSGPPAIRPPSSPATGALYYGIPRLLAVGAVLGLELAIALRNDTSSGLVVFGATACTYVAAVLIISTVVRATRTNKPSVRAVASAINAGATVLCAFGLYGVSRVTEVSIKSTHGVRKLPWMPLTLAIPIGGAALAGLIFYLWRGRTPGRIWASERWMILLVALPAAFFVLHARLPGDLGLVGSFEEGQLLVGANQVMHGAFPWRDIILAHGVFNDALLFMPGMVFIELSRWGAWAGYYLLVEPTYWLLFYGLVLYLTRGRWAYAVLFLGVVVLGDAFLGGFFSHVNARFLPLPLVLIGFGLLLERPTWIRAIAFTGGLLVLVVLTPEALFLVPLAAGILFVFELTSSTERGDWRRFRLQRFPRLLRSLVVGAVGLVVLVAWLAWNNALGAFIFYFKTFVPAHILEGVPIENPHHDVFVAGMYVPIVLAVLYLVAVTLALLWRRRVRTEDWVGTLLAGATVLYYAKFLGRADEGHLFQFLAVTTPFLFYLAYRTVDSAQAWLGRRRWRSQPLRLAGRYAVTGVLLGAVFLPSSGALATAVRDVPAHFIPKVSSPAEIARVGYATGGPFTRAELDDLRRIFVAVGGAHPRVWDFTNSPGYMYFIENFAPPTRYDNVSIAIRSTTQRDVISELRKVHPDVVVYQSTTGLQSWDGITNMVRHYDVSGWLLHHYHPVVGYVGNVIFARNSNPVSRTALQALRLSQPLDVTTDLYTDGVNACDWGYIPNFFAPHPAREAPAQALALADAGRREIISGRVTRGATDPQVPVGVFATARGALVAAGHIDQQLGVFPSGIGFGFQIDVPLGNLSPQDVSPFVQLADGSVRPLAPSKATAGSNAGTVETTQVAWEQRVTLPASAARNHWLELTNRSGAPLEPDSFTLSRVNEESHGIYFSTRSGPPTPFRVRLDNCSQWAGLPGNVAVLLHAKRQSGLALRLLA